MIGLIKKDLFLIKGNFKSVLVVLFVFTLMTFQGTADMSFVLPLISVMLFMSTFSYDEYNNWNAYALTLPNGRKNIVKSKYIASLLLVGVCAIITALISICVGYSNNNIDFEKILSSLVGSVCGVLLIIIFVYPLILKFGIEKGRIGLFIIIFIFTTIGGFLLTKVNLQNYSSLTKIIENFWMIIVPLIMTILLFGSYYISKKIFEKKEF